MLRTGYAALSRNGAKEKLRSVATCFSLRSDKARAAASGAREWNGTDNRWRHPRVRRQHERAYTPQVRFKIQRSPDG